MQCAALRCAVAHAQLAGSSRLPQAAAAPQKYASHTASLSVLQGFLAFNATAHSLISTALSRRKEAQAARVIARIAQLAVGISLVLGLGLYTGAWYCMVPRVPKRMGWPEEGAAGACAEQGRGLLVSPG